ncbi:MerR family transcriptional regulator [Acidithiobacillus sp. AMEEHan]|uniref:MerR family transcriptional regulator n=1 Tax=Acidithiobacillus sp. AMEEHan TaxID=2994951 RepID=UPI0027E53F54|nr:MerR family transcriptional regulator [Acidithiobacillus sp. AMEEHan]
MQAEEHQYPISVVEQETGISKELLRMWERRYDFPVPARDSSGNRLYSREQIERLQNINKLLAAGYRPGFVVGANEAKLQRLLEEIPSASSAPIATTAESEVDALWGHLTRLDFRHSAQLLRQHLANLGVQTFILHIAAPLYQQLAQAELGEAVPDFVHAIAQEQLLESMSWARAMLPPAGANNLQILLANLPGEGRELELQMTRTLLLGSGADVLFLGYEPASAEILACLQHCPVPVLQIAVSAASVNAKNQQLLQQLRRGMPASTSLWLSGSGAEELDPDADGMPRFRRLRDLLEAVQSWQKPLRES